MYEKIVCKKVVKQYPDRFWDGSTMRYTQGRGIAKEQSHNGLAQFQRKVWCTLYMEGTFQAEPLVLSLFSEIEKVVMVVKLCGVRLDHLTCSRDHGHI